MPDVNLIPNSLRNVIIPARMVRAGFDRKGGGVCGWMTKSLA